VAIARIFPTIAGDAKGTANAARRQDYGTRAEHHEAAAFPVIGQRAGGAPANHQQTAYGGFHEDINAPVHTVVLQRANHLQPRTVAYVRQARIGVAAEVALQNLAIFRAIE
jgi:hypothetical protein